MRLTKSAALMTAALSLIAAGILIGNGEASHHPGGMDAMSIDMNVAGNTNAALGPVQNCARINENNLVDANEEDILAVSRTVTNATATSLTDAAGGWLVNQWAGNRVVITAGTGAGQGRTIASNTANTLTITAAWVTIPDSTSFYEIRFTDAVRADVTALGIPAHNNAGTPSDPRDDAGGIIAHSFDLTYPAGIKIAKQTSAESGITVLTRNAGGSVFDSSESTPESDGLLQAGALDTGSGIPESGSGVLTRLVLQSYAGALTAVYPLGLSNNVHVDASGAGYAPDATNDSALIAINTACPAVDSDSDGWSDAAEAVIGTDPLDSCADSVADDAWPADINNNGVVGIIDDIAKVAGDAFQSVPPAPGRHDVAPDPPNGNIGIIDDMSTLAGFFGQSCS
jgi:hypothetical protein